MRAVAVRAFRGIPELLDLPVPVPGPDELLVRVGAAGVNPYDWKIADGLFEGRRPHIFPLVLGVDAAGRVEATGTRVSRFERGDRVFGQFLHDPVGRGTYAEFALVPETNALVRTPPGLSDEVAAALPTAGMTALDILDRLPKEPGSRVVIVGASGGIGSYLVQLAAQRRLRVIAAARAASHARLTKLGAAETVDSHRLDWPSVLLRSHPEGVSALVDLARGTAEVLRTSSLLRKGGLVLSTVGSADAASLSTRGLRGVNINLQPSSDLLGRIAGEVDSGRLQAEVARSVPLTDAVAVLSEVRAGRADGKIVLRV